MEAAYNADVVIIGAGLTGLTAAYYLQKHGLRIALLEKNSRTGGVIQTLHEKGFVYEAGPNTGVISHPEVTELFEDLKSLCRIEIANPKAKRRLIWKSGRWHALPDGFVNAVKTPLFSFKDKLRILGEPFFRKGTDPFETIEDLVIRRLGRSYLDYAVDPFISGVYAGNPANLVTRYALPKLYALEQDYGSFIRGAIKKSFLPKDPRMKKATREVFSAENGLGSLIKALEEAIGPGNIHLNAEKIKVQKETGKYTVNATSRGNELQFHASFILSTADAGSISHFLPFLSVTELSPVTELKYAKVTQVVLGYEKWEGIELNAFGGLVPSKEKRKILGVLFTSSFFKNRAPEKGALLSVFIGGMKHPEWADLTDSQLKELVFAEIGEMLHVNNREPEILRIFRYNRAIPQYGKSSKERLDAIQAIQGNYPGLILAGGIRDGIGMADRIRQAKTIADEINISIKSR